MLQRKEIRPVEIGTYASLKPLVRAKMYNSTIYKEQSASYMCELIETFIVKKTLRKTNKVNNRILAGDLDLVHIVSEPFKGVLNVIPLCVLKDNPNGVGVRSLLENKKTFLIRKDSLNYVTPNGADSKMKIYNFVVKDYLAKIINSENFYNLPSFSWAGR